LRYLGVVENVFYNGRGYGNAAGNEHLTGNSVLSASDWFNITPNNAAVELTCSFQEERNDLIRQIGKKNYSCLLAVGIAFGSMERGKVEMVKYVGGGKILAMV
jgi:hypothetical protein